MTAAQSPVPSTPATVASLPRLDLPALSEAAAMPPLAAPTSAALPALVLPTLAPPTLALTATPPSPDIPASLLGGFDLERFYPREARARGWGGRTRLELSIDATGTVTAVRVIDSTPAGVFDEAARRLGVTLRFSPATRNGQALATRQPLLIAWTLQ
jgi:protein TonB